MIVWPSSCCEARGPRRLLEHSQKLVRIAQAVATMCCGPCAADRVAADPVLRTCAADLFCGPLCLLLPAAAAAAAAEEEGF